MAVVATFLVLCVHHRVQPLRSMQSLSQHLAICLLLHANTYKAFSHRTCAKLLGCDGLPTSSIVRSRTWKSSITITHGDHSTWKNKGNQSSNVIFLQSHYEYAILTMKDYHRPRKSCNFFFFCLEIQCDRGIVDFDAITVVFRCKIKWRIDDHIFLYNFWTFFLFV